MQFGAIIEGIPEVQNVGAANVLIQSQSELIRVLVHYLGRSVDVGSIVGRREIAEKILRDCRNGRHVELVVWVGPVEKDIEKLVPGILTKSSDEASVCL